jgi:hypothetical protein
MTVAMARLEIVRFDPYPDPVTGYRVVQVALDGRLAVPLDIHESEYRDLSADQFDKRLMRQAEIALSYYGDHRQARLNEDGTIAARAA